MNAEPPPLAQAFRAQMAESIVRDTKFSINLGGHVITTTEDKVRLAVMTHLSLMEKPQEWGTPAGILIAVVATFATAEFKTAWLPADTWRAVFFLVGLSSFIWLLRALWRWFKVPTIDDFVKTLKDVSKP
jgi:hypothetical protein